MLPGYTFALGGTKKIKEFLEWLESQPATGQAIKEKGQKKDPAV